MVSGKNYYFFLFINNDFYNLIVKIWGEGEMHKTKFNSKWEDTNSCEIRSYIEILIYIGLIDLLEIKYYLLDDFCMCPTVRQTMTLTRF
jgi:hypothetical protein